MRGFQEHAVFVVLVLAAGAPRSQEPAPTPAAGPGLFAPGDEIDNPASIVSLMRRVNAWTAEHPWKERDHSWVRSTWYAGVMAFHRATGDPRIADQAIRWAETHGWKVCAEDSPANRLACAQTYLELAELAHDPALFASIRAWVDSDHPEAPAPGRVWYLEAGRRYADSLFVAPPALVMLGRATGEAKYVALAHEMFRDVARELLDEDAGLFFRDRTFMDRRTGSGKKILWSRGNGWVIAGIARILDHLPSGDPRRPEYEALFRRMASALAAAQGEDGFWRSNLADPGQHPGPESSGTAFFTFALAWGIGSGLLDRAAFEPVARRGWRALVSAVDGDGRLGWVQPIGAAPRAAAPDQAHEYAAGAFLLAGAEMVRLAPEGQGGGPVTAEAPPGTLDLAAVRREILAWCESLRDAGGPFGCYRRGPGRRPDLYASCDVALLRTIMGEDLRTTLDETRRREWIDHLNSWQVREDGRYEDTFGHHALHANGMVIGALGVLGGRQRHPVKLYEAFDAPEEVAPWLESAVDWRRLWSGSHRFWGGLHCFSLGRRATPEWRDRVFAWLDANLDAETGWWRKGVPPSDRHQALGGGVHILPIYEHHGRRFPLPERAIDSVLALQLPSGRWFRTSSAAVTSYLDLDALYALRYLGRLAPGHRPDDISAAAGRYADLVCASWPGTWRILATGHPHQVLAATGTLGLLRQLLPGRFPDSVAWSDIFSDPRLYRTAEADAPLPAGGGR